YHAGARHEPAASRLPLQQALRFEHAHDPVCGRLGQTQKRSEFGNTERAARSRHCLQNCDSLDGGECLAWLLRGRGPPFIKSAVVRLLCAEDGLHKEVSKTETIRLAI